MNKGTIRIGSLVELSPSMALFRTLNMETETTLKNFVRYSAPKEFALVIAIVEDYSYVLSERGSGWLFKSWPEVL